MWGFFFALLIFLSLSPPASMSIKVAVIEIEIHILISGSANKRVFYSPHISPPQIITTSGMEKFQKQSWAYGTCRAPQSFCCTMPSKEGTFMCFITDNTFLFCFVFILFQYVFLGEHECAHTSLARVRQWRKTDTRRRDKHLQNNFPFVEDSLPWHMETCITTRNLWNISVQIA